MRAYISFLTFPAFSLLKIYDSSQADQNQEDNYVILDDAHDSSGRR